MIIRSIIDVLEVKEKQARALLTICKEKMTNEELQKTIDNYCSNMVESVMEKYKTELEDSYVRMELKKYITNVGANKAHSGKRVFECFYKRLIQMENKMR